jgi:hypothetical protein
MSEQKSEHDVVKAALELFRVNEIASIATSERSVRAVQTAYRVLKAAVSEYESRDFLVENHVFTCAVCSRQWTVVSNHKLECFFTGLCYWCLRETGVTQEAVRDVVVGLTQKESLKP